MWCSGLCREADDGDDQGPKVAPRPFDALAEEAVAVRLNQDEAPAIAKRPACPTLIAEQEPPAIAKPPACPPPTKQAPAITKPAACPPLAEQAILDKYANPDTLISLAERGDVKLVSARWLVQFAKTRAKEEPLKRQQDLPEAAFVQPAWLRARGVSKQGLNGEYIIVAVSHCWLTATHPDPMGQQLPPMARVLALMLDDWLYRHCADIAVFWDFISLPQQPRSVAQEAAFRRGLEDVGLCYAHALTWVFMLTRIPAGWPEAIPFPLRGWPTFERRMACLVKESGSCLDLGAMARTTGDWQLIFCKFTEQCKHRTAPQTPEAFEKELGAMHFRIGADAAFVQAKYRQAAIEALACIEQLDYANLKWAPEDVEELVQVLPMLPNLRTLILNQNYLGDSGVAALAQALPGCSKLEELSLNLNNIGDAGALKLAQALESCPALRKLDLRANIIGWFASKALRKAARASGRRAHIDLNLQDQRGRSACVLQ